MSVPYSNTKLRVPKGFQNILEGMAREILRSQPSDICRFASAHFENLVKLREETGHDPAVLGAKNEDRFYNNNAFKDRSVDPSDPIQQQAALKIQTKQRQHAAKKHVEELRKDKAATTIQSKVRGDIDRTEVKSASPDNKDRQFSIDIDFNDPEVIQAATKIQAGYRGFKARHSATGDQDVSANAPKGISQSAFVLPYGIDPGDEEMQAAAKTIQKAYRRYSLSHKATTEDHPFGLDPDDEEMQAAAQKIQKAYRRFSITKKAQVSGQPSDTKEDEDQFDIDENDEEMQAAARRIQQQYRRYSLSKKNEQEHEDESANALNNEANDFYYYENRDDFDYAAYQDEFEYTDTDESSEDEN